MVCYSMTELMREHATGSKRRWVFRRFNQDPLESVFDQVRDLCGSNADMDRVEVDRGMSELKVKGLKKLQELKLLHDNHDDNDNNNDDN